MLPPGWQITPVIVITISLFGCVGNLLCIIVLTRKEMRSPHVYNLIGLCSSDLILLLIAAVRTLDHLITSVSFVNASKIFFPVWICNSGTKYFTVAISMERFLAVTYPMKHYIWMTLKKAKLTALAIFGFCLALSIYAYFHLNYIDPKSYSLVIVIALHFVPFVLVVLFNLFIFLGLRRYQKNRQSLTREEMETESITRMLFVVVSLFGICSLVEVIRRIWIFFDASFTTKNHYEIILNHFTDILYVFNSAANFVIFCLCGTKFRKTFLKVFGWSKTSKKDESKEMSSSSSSSATSRVSSTLSLSS